jgi:general secretion pathway protein M
MMGSLEAWYLGRARREQLLLVLMVAIALPILAWLVVVRPLTRAYDDALERHIEAVDRHGRVAALTEASPDAAAPSRFGGDLAQLVTQVAGANGITLERVSPAGRDSVDVAAIGASGAAYTRWLQQFDRQGLRVEQMTLAPQPDGTVNLSTRLTRA